MLYKSPFAYYNQRFLNCKIKFWISLDLKISGSAWRLILCAFPCPILPLLLFWWYWFTCQLPFQQLQEERLKQYQAAAKRLDNALLVSLLPLKVKSLLHYLFSYSVHLHVSFIDKVQPWKYWSSLILVGVEEVHLDWKWAAYSCNKRWNCFRGTFEALNTPCSTPKFHFSPDLSTSPLGGKATKHHHPSGESAPAVTFSIAWWIWVAPPVTTGHTAPRR